MNVFTFTGNLGKDCRVGNGVLGFAVAVKSGFGNKEQTLWVDCSLWGKRAEGKLSEYLVKGAQVAVSGELGQREHDGKVYLTCNVSSVDLIGGRDTAKSAANPALSKPDNKAPEADEDIPF